MIHSKGQLALSVGFALGLHVLLGALNRFDSSRAVSHLVASGLVIAMIPFMRLRITRFGQVWTLGWLFGDIAFRGMLSPAMAPGPHSTAWRLVLAVAYAAMLLLVAVHDRAVTRTQPQLLHRERA